MKSMRELMNLTEGKFIEPITQPNYELGYGGSDDSDFNQRQEMYRDARDDAEERARKYLDGKYGPGKMFSEQDAEQIAKELAYYVSDLDKNHWWEFLYNSDLITDGPSTIEPNISGEDDMMLGLTHDDSPPKTECMNTMQEGGRDDEYTVRILKNAIGDIHPQGMSMEKLKSLIASETGYGGDPNYGKLFDRAYREFYGIESNFDDTQSDNDEDDYTDWSMRQGESGNPGRGMFEGHGQNIKVHDFRGMSHGRVYDKTQTTEGLSDGDVFIADGATGFLYKAWPVLVAGESSVFHTPKEGVDWAFVDAGKYKDSEATAEEVADEHGIVAQQDEFRDTEPGIKNLGDKTDIKETSAGKRTLQLADNLEDMASNNRLAGVVTGGSDLTSVNIILHRIASLVKTKGLSDAVNFCKDASARNYLGFYHPYIDDVLHYDYNWDSPSFEETFLIDNNLPYKPSLSEKAPKGWEGTVKAMKKHSDEIDNPWALAHWMKNKGYKSHEKSNEDFNLPSTVQSPGGYDSKYGNITPEDVEAAYAARERAVQQRRPNVALLTKIANEMAEEYEQQQAEEIMGRRTNPDSRLVPESHVDTCRQTNKAIARKACKMEETIAGMSPEQQRQMGTIKKLIYNQGAKDGEIAAETDNPEMNTEAALELWFIYRNSHNLPPDNGQATDQMEQAYEEGFKQGFGGIDEDLNNGYYDRHTARGADYFPTGADGPVTFNKGPAGAHMGDNPEHDFMQIAETHKELVYKYRAYLKESSKPKKRLVEATQVSDIQVQDIHNLPETDSESISFDGTFTMSATVINRQGVAVPIGYDADVNASAEVGWEDQERDVAGPAGPESDTYETYQYASCGPITVSAASFPSNGVYLYQDEPVTLEGLRDHIDDDVLKQLLAPEIYIKALTQPFDDAAQDIDPPDNSDDFNEPDYDDYDSNFIDDSNYGRFR